MNCDIARFRRTIFSNGLVNALSCYLTALPLIFEQIRGTHMARKRSITLQDLRKSPMFKKLGLIALCGFLLTLQAPAQTTNGLMTGVITDSSGAVIAGVQIGVTNQATGIFRTTTSDNHGHYIILQLPPGIYEVSVKKQGFATENRQNVQLEVNQSVTLDFKLAVSSVAQTITVTGAAPLLNTTSPTLSNVVDHEATVDLPLNGREFTQLTLLSPGSAPVQNGQQTTFTVALGAGGISPSVNGQQGYQNNYTMDGVLNNATYTDIWAIAPPPDAIEEFNVQAHITDAQFAVSSGANINVVTRSGTNRFRGAVWEFLRNDAFDAQTFPASARLPYRQNQYGLYFGGPLTVPHVINGKDHTWFSLYWEGFRSTQSNANLSDTLTSAMMGGDFSAVLGTKVIGTDSLGRPEYANQIYDPETSRPDPNHPKQFLRDPFPNNTIPATRLNPASLLILKKYYPAPNLNVAAGVLPNYEFNGVTAIASDVFGIRMDHRFTENDTAFARFNRSNVRRSNPEGLPTYTNLLTNYAQQAALGYTHIFSPKAILNFRYGYTYTHDFGGDEPAGAAFANSIPGFPLARPAVIGVSFGPSVTIANGYSAVSQGGNTLGPQEGMDYHADLSKIVGNHTLGVGAMYYHLRFYDDGWVDTSGFTQNATAQDGTAGPTGYGPASFLLGTLDTYVANVGNTGADQTINWYGLYAQDQWQATPRLVLVAGLRWDYVSPPNYHKIVSGLNALNGQFIVTGAVPPNFPQATGSKGYFNPQYNGYEPRFGITYNATNKTVVHGAFAMLDDHNNSLIQENQNIRLSWPVARQVSLNSLDLGIPQMFIDSIPPAASYLSSVAPYASFGANPDNKIPYSMQFNFGLQQQLSNSMAFKVDYVGSLNRHGYIAARGNTALYPGPGPVLNRVPYPQYGGPFAFAWNVQPSSYNALQAQVQKSLSAGLLFHASYTWGKSLDWMSNPYYDAQNFYDLKADWGPSEFSFEHLFVMYGVYALPVGRAKMFLSSANRFVQAIAGDWMLSSIISLHSGQPFNVNTGADTANSGSRAGFQRPNRTGVSPYATAQTHSAWLNKAAFAQPASYTYGNERRDDLSGPAYRNVDFGAAKNFPLLESTLQFRTEFFNVFNQTNYGMPNATLNSGAFGTINTAYSGRIVQFALKLLF